MYQIIWKEKATESLTKLDRTIAKKIFNRVEKHLTKEPFKLGKPLTGEYKGLYRYRCYDDYRVIYEVKQNELLILVVKVGHRKEIYR